jgi:Leucine-rich repeat (LRR) protein
MADIPHRDVIARVFNTHPLVPMLFRKHEECGVDDLAEVINYFATGGGFRKGIPTTLTTFYKEYVNLLIKKHLSEYPKVRLDDDFIQDMLCRFGRLAFARSIRKVRISVAMLYNYLPKQLQTLPDGRMDLDFMCMGLLTNINKSPSSKHWSFHFNEHPVEDYFVALFLSNECQRDVLDRSWRIVSAALRDSIHQLPMTGDILRMTFGLMKSKDDDTLVDRRVLLHYIIKEASNTHCMSKYDIANFCIEAIYESNNRDNLSSLLEDFTINQSICFTNFILPGYRRIYLLGCIGYLIRESGSVFALHMSNFGLIGEDICFLADPSMCVSDNSLQLLNLSYNNLGELGVKKLQSFLVKASYLSHLDLSHCAFGPGGAATLAQYFMCLPLASLSICGNHIEDDGITKIANNFKYLTTLETLDLAENKITDVGAVFVAHNLKHLINLQSLDLRKNQLGDAGAATMCSHLDGLSKFRNLSLADNRVGEQGACEAAAHIWKLLPLQMLNLSLNRITPTGITELRKAADSHGKLLVDATYQSPPKKPPQHQKSSQSFCLNSYTGQMNGRSSTTGNLRRILPLRRQSVLTTGWSSSRASSVEVQ